MGSKRLRNDMQYGIWTLELLKERFILVVVGVVVGAVVVGEVVVGEAVVGDEVVGVVVGDKVGEAE